MGRATTASTKNFQRQPLYVIQYARGNPTKNRTPETSTPRRNVSPNACQSIHADSNCLLGYSKECSSQTRAWRGSRIAGEDLWKLITPSKLCARWPNGHDPAAANPGTPPGNYSITVTAAWGSLNHSVQAVLTVQ